MTARRTADSPSAADPRRGTLSYATAVGLFLALFGLAFLDSVLRAVGLSMAPARVVVAKWVLTAALLAIVLRGEGRSLESIGIRRPGRRDLAAAIELTVVGFVTLAATFAVLPSLGFESAGDAASPTATEAVAVTLLVVPLTSGVTEELWFRGYALERLEELTASTWLAAIATVAVFVSLHVPTHGLAGVLGILPLSVVLTLGYLWRRNVVVVMTTHVLINVVGAAAAVFGAG